MPIIDKKLGVDDRDKIILDLMGKDPSISQGEIGKKVELSQPSVGARIQKLKEKGILNVVSGFDFSKVDLFLAKAEIQATDTHAVLESFEHCPFFINGLIMSGKNNLSVFLTAPTIEELEDVVNYHLRGHKLVKDVQLDIVIKPSKSFVLPVAFDTSGCENKGTYKERCSVCPVRKKVFNK